MNYNLKSHLSFAATFITSLTGQPLCSINGKLYKRIKGRMYRSYYVCVEEKCNAEIIVNDLKGGFLKIIREHRSSCKNRESQSLN